jgi:exopolyphosphatase/guanosine-5'-triphosphate,3'-diphosphate pyrophosphatase
MANIRISIITFAGIMSGTTAQKVAVLDLGTNTFNLLLVQITAEAYYIFHNEKAPVMIGKSGISRGIIAEEAQARAMTALKHYKQIIDSENIPIVHGFATSAFRDASNGRSFRDKIAECTGLHIEIIDGSTEAQLIYQGVQTAMDIGGDSSLIMDIGGGSVEFILANRKEVFWKRSFNIGAQRLLDRFHQVDPIPVAEIKKLEAFLASELSELSFEVNTHRPKCMIGCSGTFDTLSEIFQYQINRFAASDATELPLTIDGFSRIYHKMISLNRSERLKLPGMIEMRVDMIVVAACLVKFVLDRSAIEQMRVSRHALKEGLITQIQHELKIKNEVSSFFS